MGNRRGRYDVDTSEGTTIQGCGRINASETERVGTMADAERPLWLGERLHRTSSIIPSGTMERQYCGRLIHNLVSG